MFVGPIVLIILKSIFAEMLEEGNLVSVLFFP